MTPEANGSGTGPAGNPGTPNPSPPANPPSPPGKPGKAPVEAKEAKPPPNYNAPGLATVLNVNARPVEQEMRKSFLDYAMSVIVARALPDARDGLKPVHRRILYGMTELGMGPTSAYKKSARVVGDVLGKYHPHGDSAVYEAMVRMAQEWSLRYVLVDGQGNFGSVDGDSAAAMRYTESRLARFSQQLLADLDKETVDFVPNFDGSLQEPSVLPSAVPNLLVNGSAGIAVGMATNVPPHNLTEITDAAIRLIEEPGATSSDLMAHVQGPDFPTGGIIYGKGGIISYLSTGRGRVVVRGAHTIEKMDRDRERIVFHEIPYQVNKSDLLIAMAELVKDKVIEGISDLRDESDRRGMRVVIELKRDAIADVVLNQLWKHTALQSSFAVNNLALVDGRPKTMGLRELILVFLKHRFEVVTRRTQFELRKAEARAHILEGLLKALANIDAIVALIRASRDPEVALSGLMAQFGLTEIQGKAILDMRLQRLTGLETEAVKAEHQQLQVQIAYYKGVLADPAQVYAIIKEELGKARADFGDKRRTQIVEGDVDIDDESLIPEEESVFMLTQEQYVKRMPIATWKEQGRGGKGLRSMALKGGEGGDEGESKAGGDEIVNVTVGSTHDFLCYFTNKGRLYWLKGYRVPTGSRQAKGKPLVNLLNLEGDERVETIIPIRNFDEPNQFLLFATRKGLVKRTELAAYGNVRTVGIQAISLEEGDSLLEVVKTDGKKEIILGTELGQAVRFDEAEVRAMGRTAYGVWGVDLEAGDHVVSLGVAEPGCELLTVTEKGYGKRTPLEEYRKTARGAKGVRTIIVNDRNGKVVCVRPVKGDESLLVLTALGIAIRMKIGGEGGISTIGRSTQGVRVVRLDDGDLVSQVALLPPQEDDEQALVLPPELTGGPPPDAPPASGPAHPGHPAENPPGQPSEP